MIESRRTPCVVTGGEALTAVLPTLPVPFDAGVPLRLYVGGAEVNFAVGIVGSDSNPASWVALATTPWDHLCSRPWNVKAST